MCPCSTRWCPCSSSPPAESYSGSAFTPLQLCGILISSIGVLVIIAQGQLSNLRHLQFNWGDIIIVFNMMVFAVYAVYLRKRPPMHWMSFHLCFRRRLGAHDVAIHGLGNGLQASRSSRRG
jgi:hypothetical protein